MLKTDLSAFRMGNPCSCNSRADRRVGRPTSRSGTPGGPQRSSLQPPALRKRQGDWGACCEPDGRLELSSSDRPCKCPRPGPAPLVPLF